MREGSKQLRRLGLAAVLSLLRSLRHPGIATASASLACGSARGPWRWLDHRNSPESVGLDGRAAVRHRRGLKETEANVHAVVIVRHGRLVFEQYFPGYDEPWGHGRRATRFRCDDQARHALGFEERDLAAGGHRDRSQADQERRRACRQILSGLFGAEIAGLGQHHPSPSADHVVGHSMGREPRLERSARTTNRISATKPIRSAMSCRSRSQHLRTRCGITMAVERTCSATSSSGYRANRWKRSRARRCSSPLASPTGNG